MNKVTILIEDNKEFGDVAFLVDKPEVLNTIEILRKKWGITKTNNLNQFNSWKNNLFEQRSLKQGEQDRLTRENIDDLSDCDLEVWKEKIERVMPDVDFECDVRDLRITFNRPETFDKAISYAIVCGIIPDGVYKSTYFAVEAPTTPLRLQDRTSRIAIYVTPQSKEEDVIKALLEVKKKFFKEKYMYFPFYSLYDKDEATKIKRDRAWYWMKQEEKGNGKGAYNRILERWNKECPDPNLEPHDLCKHCIFETNVIEQAVSRYRKALKTDT